jgi:antitoxin YobK
MSNADYQRALEVISQRPELADFVGHREESLLNAAERALGLVFPATYRRFLSELGGGNFGGFEIYGIVDDEFVDSSVPNGIWLTLTERSGGLLLDNLVVIGATGHGNVFVCSGVSRHGEESRVFEYSYRSRGLEQVASDFGEYFLRGVVAEIE